MLAYHYSFEWDERKNKENQNKHGVSFEEAQGAFLDQKRLIYKDVDHSSMYETRYYCIGEVNKKICTVRFTFRNNIIRIYGAGFWRKERRLYETRKK